MDIREQVEQKIWGYKNGRPVSAGSVADQIIPLVRADTLKVVGRWLTILVYSDCLLIPHDIVEALKSGNMPESFYDLIALDNLGKRNTNDK